ncbi:MAG: UvrD-helicase domain-containing protein [Treponema sp.]|nr:UvrD-helicase domain-containing protein [Treponema sp.]
MSNNFSYLDFLDKKLDESQKAACCRELNTVVAAGAGSGKTQVIATRFAWLVMSCNIKVDEILTLTFTKKAASEIYQRIYKTLNQFATNTQTPPEEKERAKQAFIDFDKARIQTLDSYSYTVATQAANRYGIRPNFTLTELESIKPDAFKFLINHKDEDALLAVAKPGKLHNLADELFASSIIKYTDVTCEKNFFEKKFQLQCNEIMNAWNRMMSSSKNDDYPSEGAGLLWSINEINAEYENTPKEKFETPYFEKLTTAINTEIDFFKINDLSDFQLNYDTICKMINDVVEWLELFSFNQNLRGHTKPMQRIIKSFKTSKETIESLASFILNFKHIKRICELLDMFMEQVNNQKRKTGNLSFNDVNALALKILKEQKEIRNQEKSSFKKIMIDEFQDNNGRNRNMLYLLAEKDDRFTEPCDDEDFFLKNLVLNLSDNKLYFVGDEKQSIYRFRGADVSVFNSLAKDLSLTVSPNTETKLFMTNNYRSTQIVLAMFNRLFGDSGEGEPLNYRIFDNDNQKQFEAYYSKDATFKDSKIDIKLSKENVPMHVCVFNNKSIKENIPEGKTEDDYLNADDTVAFYTAMKIRNHFDKAAQDGKIPKYGDYAILCRSRSLYSKLMRWLNFFNVPYNFDQQKSIFEDGPISDIFNFLRLCVAPHDKTAFAAFLCSVFAGLKVQTVEVILSILPNKITKIDETNGIVYVQQYTAFSESEETEKKIKLQIEDISIEEYQKYVEAKAFYFSMKNSALTEPLTDTITKLWYETGFRYETLLNKTANLSAEQYDLLFELVRKTQQDGYSTNWVIDQLAKTKQNDKFLWGDNSDEIGIKDISYSIEKEDSVNIMTIHKSKGLEFDNVFILDCSSSGGGDKESLIFYDEKFGISIKIGEQSNYFYKMQKADSDEKAKAEFKRLLYVAITRAKKYICTVDSFDATKNRNKSCFREAIEFFYGAELQEQNKTKTKTGETIASTLLNTSDVCYTERAPFDFELLEKVEITAQTKKETNIQTLREKISKKFDVFQDAQIIQAAENVPQKRISPSKLENLHKTNESITAFSEIQKNPSINPSIERIGKIISDLQTTGDEDFPLEEHDIRTTSRVFSYADFGTLAHAFLENVIKTNNAEIGFETKELMQKDLKNDEFEEICSICKEMALFFLETNVGKEAIDAKKEKRLCKTEYSFKLLHNNFIIKGFIDLIFQNKQGKFIIVDYKTDREIKPELYFEQQYVYRLAAKEIFGINDEKEICLKLFYLRYGQEIDITSYVNEIKLPEETMQKILLS